MKNPVLVGFTLLGVFVSSAFLNAAENKVVTLKGDIMCAKCELNEGTKCVTVIRVKEGEKETSYYFKDKGANEEYHENVCGGGRKAGTVTGLVTQKDGKKWITPKKVLYAKS